ncbi:Alcohol dehydrogenase, class IV [Natronincola peptidivorans]|uniref:Alcohol dehydrogenase, class IV n=1 Tax=Natronincola peptidivorans TaxID=426128 RepID=A0A1I0DY62_9FIRM|nr:alcohol dehydrogenase-like regulatory protein ErcA [Natronincola peptidivorans]SET37623.1 Alcohol dehydrogenase, class IV [Natronincola peptidivorans]
MMLDSVLHLRKFLAPEFVFGKDARLLIGRYTKNFGGRKALVVTDEGVINAGWVKDVIDSLEENNVDYVVFSDVTPNPRAKEVMAGAELYGQENCNIIIAVGGGSPMDCAKGIGIVIANLEDINYFEGIDKIEMPIPPLICIPTTAGSSADVSQFSIILDQKRNLKMAIVSKAIVPDVALIDPMTLTSMDDYLTACTGMDALTHAIEAYVSNARSVFTDLYALEAIRIISTNLPKAVKKPVDLNTYGQMMLGSLYAGIAFSNASLGAVHAMAHSMGGLLDTPHGECNAILLEHVIDFNYEAVAEDYREIGEAMGLQLMYMDKLSRKNAIIEHIKDLKQIIGIHKSLRDIGLTADYIPILAKYAVKDACMATNPILPQQRDVEVIYEKAY